MKRLLLIANCILMAGCSISPQSNGLGGTIVDAGKDTLKATIAIGGTLSLVTAGTGHAIADKANAGRQGRVHSHSECASGIAARSMAATANATTHDEYARFFKYGLRLESTGGSTHVMYVCFRQDSSEAELFMPHDAAKKSLERHVLPSEENVWASEGNDDYSLSCSNGCWTVSQRGRLLSKQSQSDIDCNLGSWQEKHYEGALTPMTAKERLATCPSATGSIAVTGISCCA